MATYRKTIAGIITVDVDSLLVDLYSNLKGADANSFRVILEIIENIKASRDRAEKKL